MFDQLRGLSPNILLDVDSVTRRRSTRSKTVGTLLLQNMSSQKMANSLTVKLTKCYNIALNNDFFPDNLSEMSDKQFGTFFANFRNVFLKDNKTFYDILFA